MVATPPCDEEMSRPQLAQKCAPGAMTAPQRVQVRGGVVDTLVMLEHQQICPLAEAYAKS
jgi:hypothetical protein